MTDFNGNYLVARATAEATLVPRTLKAIIEAALSVTLPGDLAAGVTIQNTSDTDLKIHHLASGATHYITISATTERQLLPQMYRIPLHEIYLTVGADNKGFGVEVIFE
jgi:hypothetical protein